MNQPTISEASLAEGPRLLIFSRPDAIMLVTQHLRTASQPGTTPTYLARTLLILLYIIKELATARLHRSRTSLQSATPEVFQVLGKIYVETVQHWMGLLQSSSDSDELANIEQSLLALRIIRRLVIAGYQNPNRHSEVSQFWTIIKMQFGEMLSLVSRHLTPISRLIEKHLVQLSKLHLEMAKVHPAAFALLPDSIGLAQAYWGLLVDFGQTFGSQTPEISARVGTDGDADEADTPWAEKLSLKGLLILRACVKMVYSRVHTFKYQQAEDKEERQQSIEIVTTGLLVDGIIRQMMETLVTRFFVFRPRDLRDWEEEPSEWERREEGEGDAWEFSIRSCAEKLFLDLVINNKNILVQPLLHVFHTVASTSAVCLEPAAARPLIGD